MPVCRSVRPRWFALLPWLGEHPVTGRLFCNACSLAKNEYVDFKTKKKYNLEAHAETEFHVKSSERFPPTMKFGGPLARIQVANPLDMLRDRAEQRKLKQFQSLFWLLSRNRPVYEYVCYNAYCSSCALANAFSRCSYPALLGFLALVGVQIDEHHRSSSAGWSMVEAINDAHVELDKKELGGTQFFGVSLDESTTIDMCEYLSVELNYWSTGVGRQQKFLEMRLISDTTSQGKLCYAFLLHDIYFSYVCL